MTTSKRSKRATRSLPDRISLWLAEHRRLACGTLIVVAAAAFGVWITLASQFLVDQRASVWEWLGGGVYAAALLAAASGVVLAGGRPLVRIRRDRVLQRRLAGAVAIMLAGWAIAGAFAPNISVGGVSLVEHSAGGRIGNWFDTPLGWAMIAASLIAAMALTAPSTSRRAAAALARSAQSALRHLSQSLREHGPGIAVGAARAIGVAVVAISRWLWVGLRWMARELWAALRVSGGHLREWRRASERRDATPVPATTAPLPQAGQPTLNSPIDPSSWPPLSESGALTETETDDEALAPAVVASSEPTAPSTMRTLERTATDGWRLPPVELLDADPTATLRVGAEERAKVIVDTLASFGVDARVTQINEGPTITQFGIEPGWEIKTRQVALKDAAGAPLTDEQGTPRVRTEEVSRTRVRVSRITRLADDLALALAAPSIRIEAPVPGQPVIGVEVPNKDRRIVALRGLIESDEFQHEAATGGLPIALGRDVTGQPVIADLTRMPHVLIAGATGSGKSVCINTIISSLLMQKSPEEVRLILVDPKRVELTGYGSAPHLAFSHVVTEPEEVVSVLGVVVAEMDRRYRRLEEYKARNIVAYNALPTVERRLPYWVVVLDELADMMMAAASDVEGQLVRLAQLARAVGIHLVVATQRPSVDVVTGLIKANFPTRIAFATTSQIDARVIMDRAGAEKLMGRGDMLYMSSDNIQPRRVQGAYVSDAEIERLLASWTSEGQGADGSPGPTLDDALAELSVETPEAAVEIESRAVQADLQALTTTLQTAITAGEDQDDEPDIVLEGDSHSHDAAVFDTRLPEATELARGYERVSASLLQRRMRLGRPRAERLIEQLEQTGVVAASDGGSSRRVLSPAQRSS